MWYVYILSNRAHKLYVGSTDDIVRRYREHVERRFRDSFTARYTYNRLVYCEVSSSQADARAREEQIKGWSHSKKVALIQAENPNWYDLARRWHRLLCLD